MLNPESINHIRSQFPSLTRKVNGHNAVFLDGPAGTQVPQTVIDAISNYLSNHNANHDGLFATSIESDGILDEAHRAAADFLGTDDHDCVSFGPNMTTLTFALSRALAKTWNPGDEIIVTRSEHDANFTPWVLAANDAGVNVQCVEVIPDECTLDLDDLKSKLSEKTRLVAVGYASNATGTIHPVKDICNLAREVGATTFVDAVHFAPHSLINVSDLGCDFLVCSAYKFFGPHVGLQYGRRQHLQELAAYKLRPASDKLPGKWMTGTQNHECIAGVTAAIDYLASLNGSHTSTERRANLTASFQAIRQYENELLDQLLDGFSSISSVKVWGITDSEQRAMRLPTVSITHANKTPVELATVLAERGIFVWHGNYYALPLTERLGLEPEGMLRIGIVHYNLPEEVQRLLHVIENV